MYPVIIGWKKSKVKGITLRSNFITIPSSVARRWDCEYVILYINMKTTKNKIKIKRNNFINVTNYNKMKKDCVSLKMPLSELL